MTPSGTLRTIDIRLIDDLFGMGSGYVLDFSDRTFAAFFAEELVTRPRAGKRATSVATGQARGLESQQRSNKKIERIRLDA